MSDDGFEVSMYAWRKRHPEAVLPPNHPDHSCMNTDDPCPSCIDRWVRDGADDCMVFVCVGQLGVLCAEVDSSVVALGLTRLTRNPIGAFHDDTCNILQGDICDCESRTFFNDALLQKLRS